ncbi:spike base protein, RCAP_Rcc01079 family [Epibacterium ulvae]|uniref:spike base protein, RCAP_Rcc01079 family n=1 Tax=Epibacterium ulvae TaxID=1156985 RepID=UPI00203EE062|nr:hypothetical protein [Epibacterium ulvae]
MVYDPFADRKRDLDSPAFRHFEITPADGVALPIRPRVLRVTSAGTLALRDERGTVLSYTVVAGETLLFSPVSVEASGTTATVVGWL